MSACTITISNGPAFTRTFIRDPYRKHLVNAVSNCFDGVSVHSTSYAHDLLSRRTNIVMTAQTGTNFLSCAYNARSEVTGVTIDTNEFAYICDNIGNSLYTSLNTVTNAYTVNSLNQYKARTNLLDLSGILLGHDSDGNTMRIDGHILSYDSENRLSFYRFGLDADEVGTVRKAYVYDHLGRRVRKMGQEFRVYDPGGMMPPTYWWHTNDVTTFVYDGWNLVHERIALTNGTTQEVSYFWGKDLSGSMQGAGGVSGLLATSIDGDFYFPCYDNNGNITAYIDESGLVIAYRQFDAFGNTIAKGGALVDTLHFWYSTKYLDHNTGLYYYGYRYYSPMLQRWINRDPIGESGGMNMYGFVSNNPTTKWDGLGLVAGGLRNFGDVDFYSVTTFGKLKSFLSENSFVCNKKFLRKCWYLRFTFTIGYNMGMATSDSPIWSEIPRSYPSCPVPQDWYSLNFYAKWNWVRNTHETKHFQDLCTMYRNTRDELASEERLSFSTKELCNSRGNNVINKLEVMFDAFKKSDAHQKW